jgi:hypothetical protein
VAHAAAVVTALSCQADPGIHNFAYQPAVRPANDWTPAQGRSDGIDHLPERGPRLHARDEGSVGEFDDCGVSAAVAAAVYNACGVRVRESPINRYEGVFGNGEGRGRASLLLRHASEGWHPWLPLTRAAGSHGPQPSLG